ncbi:hypothetical protein G6F24_018667 [Rhizopus arrhizus]|nr:hypothetical protein G6F24_018667 [Rhizopus arrhizus]
MGNGRKEMVDMNQLLQRMWQIHERWYCTAIARLLHEGVIQRNAAEIVFTPSHYVTTADGSCHVLQRFAAKQEGRFLCMHHHQIFIVRVTA